MMKPLAYFTDLGGCLVPDYLDSAWAILSRQYGIASEMHQEVERTIWERYAYLPGKTPYDNDTCCRLEREAWAQFCVLTGIHAESDDLIAATCLCAESLDPNYAALFERLQEQGIVLGVISNNTPFWWNRQCASLGLDRFFPRDRVILSCDYGVSKKSPGLELFNAAVKASGLPPDQCLFTDDRTHNVEFSLRAGFGAAILHPRNIRWGSAYIASILTLAGVLQDHL
jgi:FMN phosphatase YigB (HAD superfamily)